MYDYDRGLRASVKQVSKGDIVLYGVASEIPFTVIVDKARYLDTREDRFVFDGYCIEAPKRPRSYIGQHFERLPTGYIRKELGRSSDIDADVQRAVERLGEKPEKPRAPVQAPKIGDVVSAYERWNPIKERGEGKTALLRVERVHEGIQGGSVAGMWLDPPHDIKPFSMQYAVVQLAKNYGPLSPEKTDALVKKRRGY